MIWQLGQETGSLLTTFVERNTINETEAEYESLGHGTKDI